ncbi:hypothetical protein L3X38_031040 [Prunus dulcis]|uniref:Retrotransposon Copia-like N-terminal domain-containing protein n=1 Tax=Prunus dulcis TaxID=3755 RepID=A0AAD4YV76_PRUDU|nr:hypothetical protein L3X38_031040 [Prunus dulcis]
MDIVSTSKSTDSTPLSSTPPTSQIVTIHSDNTLFPTRIILTETNYAFWPQVIDMRIAACEKLGCPIDDACNLRSSPPLTANGVRRTFE